MGPRRTGVEDGKPPADSDLGYRSRKDGVYNCTILLEKALESILVTDTPRAGCAQWYTYRREMVDIFVIHERDMQMVVLHAAPMVML
jgi:hypothetical protein